MGLLKKLPSFNKKSRNKSSERPPLPSSSTIEPPLSLKLDFEGTPQQPLQVTSTQSNVNTTSVAPSPPPPTNTTAATAGASLFDDIFSRLDQPSSIPAQDSLHTDISLAFALSEQLQLDSTPTNQPQAKEPTSTIKTSAPSSSLFGQDSIYSSYLSGIQNEGEQSMFASLLQPLPNSNSLSDGKTWSNNAPSSNPQAPLAIKKEAAAATQIVLDSDVSGSEDDDDEDDDESSGDEEAGQDKQRRTLGACPIMERRPHDHRLNVSRKVDHWAEHIEENVVDSNQSMLNRMKDRHRQQVKLQALRQQQQKQQQSFPPMVYPNTGMMMPPNPMLCATVPPISMIPAPTSASFVPLHGATTALPLDSTLTPSVPPVVAPSLSVKRQVPFTPRRSASNSPASSVDTTPRTSTTTIASAKSKDDSINNSTLTIIQNKDDMQEKEKETTTETTISDHDDADDEADDMDRYASTISKRRTPSIKKSSASSSSSSIRHSRSVPDLKKKKRKPTRTPQQTSTSAPHSVVPSPSSSTPTSPSLGMTPSVSPIPPMPLLYQQQQQQQQQQHQLKTMKSEPDMKRPQSIMPQQQPLYPHPAYQQQQQMLMQQQQLQLEWERMQLYQREQQLKQEYMQLHQRSSQIQRSSTLPSMDPRFYSSYYPTMQ